MRVNISNKELKTLFKNPKELGEVEITPAGPGLYTLYSPSAKFKQIIKQSEYNILVDQKLEPVKEPTPINEVVQDEEPEQKIQEEIPKENEVSKSKRRSQLRKMGLRNLREIASEHYENTESISKRDELIELILEAEYEEV